MPSRWAGVRGLLGLALAALLAAPASAGEALSDRVANYTIEARLDAATHTIAGHQILRWRNASTSPASELRFHLYLNAFSNNFT